MTRRFGSDPLNTTDIFELRMECPTSGDRRVAHEECKIRGVEIDHKGIVRVRLVFRPVPNSTPEEIHPDGFLRVSMTQGLTINLRKKSF